MTATSATPSGPSRPESSSIDTDGGPTPTGPFILTLCTLEGPATLRPPQAPELKQFRFFTTRAPQCDGSERIYLHMGYFQTLAHAQRLLQAVHRRFPRAIVNRAPTADPPAPGLQPRGPAAEQLTDTQVMKILEGRGAAPGQNDTKRGHGAQIGLLRPEDTTTRRALKEAVVQGEPVFFAVQLHWSMQPIDPGRVPSLPLFKIHTLYATESRRDGRSRYFLRMGFFPDAATAKEAASQVRAKFAAAVVVPVTDEEITRAREASTDTFAFPLVSVPLEDIPQSSPAPRAAAEPKRRASSGSKGVRDGTETLEETLEMLAEREIWNGRDSLSQSGVRHLRIEVLERKP